LSLSEIGGYALSEDSDIFWAWVGTLTVGFSIILFLILLGSMLVFKIKNKWSKRTLLGLFVTGFIGGVICGLLGLKTGLDMSIEGEIEREVGTAHTKELVVKADLPKIITSDNFEVKSNGRHGLISVDEKKITFHGVYFTYKRSQDSLFHIRQNLSAHSESHKTAVEKSKRIKHKVQLMGDTLMVDPSYSFPKSDKLRDQDVHMIIEIPVGAKVRFNNHLISLGSDEFDEEIVDENYQESGKLRSSGKYSHWD
jgi:hypothetical protein